MSLQWMDVHHLAAAEEGRGREGMEEMEGNGEEKGGEDKGEEIEGGEYRSTLGRKQDTAAPNLSLGRKGKQIDR